MIDNTKEYILCAGVRYNYNDPFKLAKTGHGESQLIIYGHRHSDCISTLKQILGGLFDETKIDRKFGMGFLTSKNRFVARIAGARIAIRSGQLVKGNPDDEQSPLCSEDLY